MRHMLEERQVVTSQMVLTEVLDAFAQRGEHLRLAVADAVDDILEDEDTEVVEQTSDRFHEALELYKTTNDKEWGITDCSSIIIMKQYRIREALTYDQHFVQAGYVALLRE
jgi:predicted nucleic acid-binding protein